MALLPPPTRVLARNGQPNATSPTTSTRATTSGVRHRLTFTTRLRRESSAAATVSTAVGAGSWRPAGRRPATRPAPPAPRPSATTSPSASTTTRWRPRPPARRRAWPAATPCPCAARARRTPTSRAWRRSPARGSARRAGAAGAARGEDHGRASESRCPSERSRGCGPRVDAWVICSSSAAVVARARAKSRSAAAHSSATRSAYRSSVGVLGDQPGRTDEPLGLLAVGSTARDAGPCPSWGGPGRPCGEQRRLPGAVAAHERDDLTGRQVRSTREGPRHARGVRQPGDRGRGGDLAAAAVGSTSGGCVVGGAAASREAPRADGGRRGPTGAAATTPAGAPRPTTGGWTPRRHRLGRVEQARDDAVVDDQDAVGVVDDPLEPVLGQQHRQPRSCTSRCRRQHVLGRDRVERRRGLVEHQDPRARGQHGADGHPLLLSTGELAEGRSRTSARPSRSSVSSTRRRIASRSTPRVSMP